MLKVRSDILEKLKCSHCDGYLNVTPIMVKTDKCQICGKCFKILPIEEKIKCVRQVGYESVAEMLLFPCRYNLQGCQSEFPLNEADNHELECPFRFGALSSNGEHLEEKIYEDPGLYKNLPYVTDGNVSPQEEKYDGYTTSPANSFTIFDTSECVTVKCNFTVKENKVTQMPTVLKYDTSVYGNENKGTSLFLRSTKSNSNFAEFLKTNSLKLSIEGAISLSTFQNIFCNVTVSALEEPMYDTVEFSSSSPSNLLKCAKCCGVVKNEIYHCNFGHDVCKNCKGSTCVRCASPINCVPRYYCKNYSKGCHVYLLYSEVYLHSKDCEFGEFECPLQEQCSEVSETLFALKDHLKDKHLTSIILSNLVVKQASDKDEFWIMFAFDDLFKCKRFRYRTEAEFLVEYIGPHKNSKNYKYDLYIKSDDNKSVKLMRSAICVGWDASALDQSILISENELKSVKIDILNFTYTLNLIKVGIKE